MARRSDKSDRVTKVKEEVLEYTWGDGVEIVGLGVFKPGVVVRKSDKVEHDQNGVVTAVPEDVFERLKGSQFFKVRKVSIKG